MASGVTVVRSAGKLIPKDYLELVVKNNSKAIGTAMVLATGEHAGFHINVLNGGFDVETVDKLQKSFIDSPMMLWFSNADGLKADDIQPHTVVKDDTGNPICAVILDGEFAKDQTHRQFTDTFLSTFLTRQYKGEDKDLKKFIAACKDSTVTATLRQLGGERSMQTYMFADGDGLTFSRGMQKEKYDGWSTTHPYGWKAKGQPGPVTQVATAVATGFNAFSAALKGAKAEETPASPPPPPAPELPAQTPQQDPSAQPQVPHAEPNPNTHELVGPPDAMTSPNKIQRWYTNNTDDGTYPRNYKDKPKIWRLKRAQATEDQVKQLAEHVNGPQRKTPDEPVLVKDTTVKNIPIAILDQNQVNAVLKSLADGGTTKLVKDSQGNEVLAPEAAQAMEEDIPSATEQVGLNGVHEIYHWTRKKIIQYAQSHPEWIINLIKQLIKEHNQQREKIANLERQLKSRQVEAQPAGTSTSPGAFDAFARVKAG